MSHNWEKRDKIISDEVHIQKIWKSENVFVTPADKVNAKFFGTFPYPYMNGILHLGHGYTISKLEFMARYKRLKGFNVMFPFAFHGTGMPIVSCARRLEDELKIFNTELKIKDLLSKQNNSNLTQIEILSKMNVPIEDLKNFINPHYWLTYFPKVAKKDLKRFGISADFSKSFITTDLNPYYDSFIKWQFKKLFKSNKVIFGKKPVIYSPKNNQPCSADDRSIGEDVGIKEYTLLKFKIDNLTITNLESDKYYLLVPTIRIEDSYVTTNLWVNTETHFNIFSINSDNYICHTDILRNLEHQVLIKKYDQVIKGRELLNKYVLNPITLKEIPIFYNQNEANLSMSAPGHSSSDFACYYKKTNSSDVHCVVCLKDTHKTIVEYIKEQFNNINFNRQTTDKNILQMVKKSGFVSINGYEQYDIETSRQKMLEKFVNENNAFIYYEPEDKVVSRSGDECVVAITDQWFLDYSDNISTQSVNEYIINTLKTNGDIVRDKFLQSSNWIKQWPCSRFTGLGTDLYDSYGNKTEYVIDSLSDSTIYMAYYIVADSIETIPLEYVNEDFWDYIFLKKEKPKIENLDISRLMDIYRKNFEYWYPIDLRVSGKDLISTHLTMCLYNHKFIWDDHTKLPRSFTVNGHLLLNGEKMSKSKGNFMTLFDAVSKYGADATRMALADSGTTLDDANFTCENAENAILKLTIEKEWCLQMIDQISNSNLNAIYTNNFWDNVFDSEITTIFFLANQYYQNMEYQKIIVECFHGLLTVRDQYRFKYNNKIVEFNLNLIQKYLEIHLLIISPICPHYSEYVWNYASTKNVKLKSQWSDDLHNLSEKCNKYIYQKRNLDSIISSCRSEYFKFIKRLNKSNSKTINLNIFTFGYSKKELEIIDQIKHKLDNEFSDNFWKDFSSNFTQNLPKKDKGKYCKFINNIKNNVNLYGTTWFNWINKNDDLKIISTWLHKILDLNIHLNVENKDLSDENEFKYGPWNPQIKISL